jgi:hypothetical protein
MTATTPSAALATVQPVFTESGHLAPAGFLAGYRGLTCEACTLDLRQFTAWCRIRSLSLFWVRRAGIEAFARELEARGRAPGLSPQRSGLTRAGRAGHAQCLWWRTGSGGRRRNG